MKVVIASNNEGKIREFKRLMQPMGYEVLSQAEAGVNIEVDENGKTFEENARLKAKAVYNALKGKFAVIADDSGLAVDYLGGEPGVKSARYAPVGQRKKTVLEKLEGVPKEERTASFVCYICYLNQNGEKLMGGDCKGYIGFEERGDNGFGYDSIFYMGDMGDRSFAELTDDEKNAVSHRADALKRLKVMLDLGL